MTELMKNLLCLTLMLILPRIVILLLLLRLHNCLLEPEDVFKNGLPRVRAGLGIVSFGNIPSAMHTSVNNTLVIIRNFDFSVRFKADFRKWITLRNGLKPLIKTLLLLPFWRFTGFHETHSTHAYLKSTFIEVWEKERELLELTSSRRFRDISDVNQWVFKYRQTAAGKFFPISPNISKMHKPGTKIEELIRDIKSRKYKIICHNDYALIQEIQQAYAELFLEKSLFGCNKIPPCLTPTEGINYFTQKNFSPCTLTTGTYPASPRHQPHAESLP